METRSQGSKSSRLHTTWFAKPNGRRHNHFQENRRYLLDIALGAFAGVVLCVALAIGAFFYGRSRPRARLPISLSASQCARSRDVGEDHQKQRHPGRRGQCNPQLSLQRPVCVLGRPVDRPAQTTASEAVMPDDGSSDCAEGMTDCGAALPWRRPRNRHVTGNNEPARPWPGITMEDQRGGLFSKLSVCRSVFLKAAHRVRATACARKPPRPRRGGEVASVVSRPGSR